MFGLGLWEIVAIAVVAVVLIRPQDLPKILRRLGRAYGMISRLKNSAMRRARELESEINRLERARLSGADGRPVAEAGENGRGSGDRSSITETGDDGGLVDEAAAVYGLLEQQRGEETTDRKTRQGNGRSGVRGAQAAGEKRSNTGGTHGL